MFTDPDHLMAVVEGTMIERHRAAACDEFEATVKQLVRLYRAHGTWQEFQDGIRKASGRVIADSWLND